MRLQAEDELGFHSPTGPLVELLGVVQEAGDGTVQEGDSTIEHLLLAFVLQRCRIDETIKSVTKLVLNCQPHGTASLSSSHSSSVPVCDQLKQAEVGAAHDAPKTRTPPVTSQRACETLICELVDRVGGDRAGVGLGRSTWDEQSMRVPFMDLGIVSDDAVELVARINQVLKLRLSATVLFEHPNVKELAAFAHERLAGGDVHGMPAIASMQNPVSHDSLPVVAGAHARWPGGIGTPLLLLPAGGNAIGKVPSRRWDATADTAAGRYGAFLPGSQLFDATFFSVSPAETSAMDPQQRLLLEAGYGALHALHERRASLQAKDLGIFLGIMNADFASIDVRSDSVYAATGAALSIAAGRLSFVLGTQGPCVSYDTSCSSALVALHGASSAMCCNECPSSLVLAVNLMLSPRAHTAFTRAGMLSVDGRCRTYDQRANGYARGEGVGSVALGGRGRMLALGERGRMLTVGGCTVRSDGLSASLTAPNGSAQTRLLRIALSSEHPNYVEAHGTGTPLGDPTEVGAIGRVLNGTVPCLGSAKASVGHTEPAAGLLGLLTLGHVLEQRASAVNAQLRALNTLLQDPVSELGASMPEQGLVLRSKRSVGSVSSFGYSGTIAHAVLWHAIVGGEIAPMLPPVVYRRRAVHWCQGRPGSSGEPSAAAAVAMPQSVTPPVFPSIGGLLWAQADALGERTFMEEWADGEGVTLRISFAGFAARVAVAVEVLGRHHVPSGQRVALLSHFTAQYSIYALAVISAGGVAVNLNWRQPLGNLVGSMQLSRADVLVASALCSSEAVAIHGKLPLQSLLWLQVPPAGVQGGSALPLLACEQPEGVGAWGGVRPVGAAGSGSAMAAIMFTSGSTALPKGVPLTHSNFLWACEHQLARFRELGAFSEEALRSQEPPPGTLSFLPNFHIIGFNNSLIFNLFVGVRCAVDRDAGKAQLTPSRLLSACASLRPDVLETVPWMAEAMVQLVDGGAGNALAQLKWMQVGGAAVNAKLMAPLLARHRITLWPHYGQTEVNGTCMIGGLEGNLFAMRLLPGIRYELVGDDGLPAEREGELVLFGLGGATPGYLEGSGGRLLSGSAEVSNTTRFFTGDVFRRVGSGGGASADYIESVARRDEIIVHNNGEKTNPIPIEADLLARCNEDVAMACVAGQGQPAPWLFVQLRETAAPGGRERVLRELKAVNKTLPSYSRIMASCVHWSVEPLPVSVKGNVSHSAVEKLLAAMLDPSGGADAASSAGGGGEVAAARHARSAWLETSLLAAAAELLEEVLSLDTPLIDAGLDSIVGVRTLLRSTTATSPPAHPPAHPSAHLPARQPAGVSHHSPPRRVSALSRVGSVLPCCLATPHFSLHVLRPQVELGKQLSTLLSGSALPDTLFFDCSTLRDIVRHVEPSAAAAVAMPQSVTPPVFPSIGGLLWAQADALGERTFMEEWADGEGVTLRISFAGFAARVAVAVEVLGRHHVSSGQRVALLSHFTAQYSIYALAVISAGGVAVNLNWRQPLGNLVGSMQLSRADVLVASALCSSEAVAIHGKLPLQSLLWLQVPPAGVQGGSALPLLTCEQPEGVGAWGGVRPVGAAGSGSAMAAIMFTSGSTALPKGVPLTHSNFLWACEHQLARFRELGAFSEEALRSQEPPPGTLSFLPNFHIIGFNNSLIFNLFVGVRCAVDRDAGKAQLTPSRLLSACASLRPDVLETVPWMAEAMVQLVDGGAGNALAQLKWMQVGGAAVNAKLMAPLLARHRITLWPHYGQTEVNGTCMIGGLEGNLFAMRLLPGIRYELVGDDGLPAEREGELVLFGLGGATPGYLEGSGGRLLSGSADVSNTTRFFTGDVFRRVGSGGGASGDYIESVARRDEIIVHNNGEKTNPIPIEADLLARCNEDVAMACVAGQGQPAPWLFVQLRETAAPGGRERVLRELKAVNKTLPSYSRIMASCVHWSVEPLPVSVKGNVSHSAVEKLLAAMLDPSGGADAASAAGGGGEVAAARHARSAWLETSLLAAAAELLEEVLSLDTPLIDAGLDSIVGVRTLLRSTTATSPPAHPPAHPSAHLPARLSVTSFAS